MMRQRQAAVQELRPRLDLREELSHLAAEIPTGNHLEALAEWGNQEPILISPLLRILGRGWFWPAPHLQQ